MHTPSPDVSLSFFYCLFSCVLLSPSSEGGVSLGREQPPDVIVTVEAWPSETAGPRLPTLRGVTHDVSEKKIYHAV